MIKKKKICRKVKKKIIKSHRIKKIVLHIPAVKISSVKISSVKISSVKIPSVKIPSVKIPIAMKLPRKRRSKNNSNRMYFTDLTEQAIIEYNGEDDMNKREVIFRERILYPFQKLIENIFNTFKFSYFETGSQDVQRECLTHLVSNIHKFDPSRVSKTDPTKKTKAYSYFSIIAKHYLILLNNTNYKKFNQNVEISEERDENTIQLQANDKYYAQQEMSEFIYLLIKFWENNVNKIFNKERDLNIANAVVELFRNSNRIQMFNKKALYLYIREMANVKTQQITKILNRMKIYHDKMKYSYQNDGVIETELIS